MRISGYQIRAALRNQELNRKIAAQQFKDSLHSFDGEDKPTPQDMMQRFQRAENAIAHLQVLQSRYNLAVEVIVQDVKMTLHEAVKLVSGANRAEKMWRDAAHKKPTRRGYYENDLKRSTDDIFAERTVSVDEAAQRAKDAGAYAAALREQIQLGNAISLDLEVDDRFRQVIEENIKEAKRA